VQESAGELAIRLAAPLSPDLFKEHLSHLVTSSREVRVDPKSGALTSSHLTKIGAITLTSRLEPRPSDEDIATAFGAWLSTEEGWRNVPFSDASAAFIARVRWARERQGESPSLPDLSEAILQSTVREWLLPHLTERNHGARCVSGVGIPPSVALETRA
jgi:hypothetical protein